MIHTLSRITNALLLAGLVALSPLEASAQQTETKCAQTDLSVVNSTPQRMSIESALDAVKKHGEGLIGTKTCVWGALVNGLTLSDWYYTIKVDGNSAKIQIMRPNQDAGSKKRWGMYYTQNSWNIDY